ncbi:hypothetical protein ACKFRZ_00590 [Corynebacterium gottingense]|uniref:hypothetical protein n=1 Tax=Corynebacterium gottingense TaxID=2041036 RepID=UPI0038D23C35
MALRLIANPRETLRREFEAELQERDKEIEMLKRRIDELGIELQQLHLQIQEK